MCRVDPYLVYTEMYMIFYKENHIEDYPKHVWFIELDKGQLGTGKFW